MEDLEKDQLEEEQLKTEEPEAPYIKEKIRRKKQNPIHILQRILLCVLLAVIFGAVAGFVSVVVRPWAEQIGKEETSSAVVELPTYVQDTAEDSQSAQETEAETTTIDEEDVNFSDAQRQWIQNQISNMLDADAVEISDLDEFDALLNSVTTQAQQSLSLIVGYAAGAEQGGASSWETVGVVIYANEDTQELLILADASSVTDVENVYVSLTALSDITLQATVKGWDHVYGLVVFSASTTSLSAQEISEIEVLEIGNSYEVSACDTILLIGAPYVIYGSVARGHITYVDTDRSALDSVYRLFDTDIILPEGASGFMINTDGELVGILTSNLRDSALSDYAAAIGTEELKGTLSNMMNGISSSLLGVYVTDVTEELIDQGMPAGVYVTDVQEDGPAYVAGISAGDVIVGISTSEITSVTDLTQCMLEEHLPEETVIVQVMRMSPEGYKSMEISVTLGAR